MKGIQIRAILFFLLASAFAPDSLSAQCLSGNCQNGSGTYRFSSGAKYTGKFVGGRPHGTGEIEFSNGNRYVGDWKDGVREGRGKMSFKNSATMLSYEGEFRRGKMAGTGTLLYKNGDKYTGQWENDSPNGRGTYAFASKDRYEGDFKNGKFEGQGTMIYPDGAKYTGGWKDNRKSGSGKFYTPNGELTEGVWANGELVKKQKPSTQPDTQDADNEAVASAKPNPSKADVSGLRNCTSVYCRSGKGYFDYPDGSRWVGEFKEGYPEGKGVCYYANGDRYEGEWARNAPHGDGVMRFASGRVYGATWMNGAPVKELDADEGMPEDDEPVNVEASKKVRVWAVIVGVGRYNHMPTLKFTDDDAYQVYAFLKSPEGGALPESQISLLIDEAATRDNILRAMRQTFGKADENDVVMMYFSGHGLEGCFLPVDFDGYSNKLRHDEVRRVFAESKAKHKLCIADACHSGTMQSLAARSPVTVTLDKYYAAFENTDGGTALLMSSKGEELSLEDHGLRQGVFSHYLLRGMKGAADKNSDSIVTIREIYNYVYAKVREYTANVQTPVLTGDFDDNMPVAVRR